jgi:hypothetical protein
MPENVRALQGYVAILRVALALVTGDVVRARAFGQRAMELVSASDTTWRVAALVGRAIDYQVTGDVTPAAEQKVAEAVAAARASSDYPALILAATALWGTC